jgi:membrane-associated phospholipid phosphatase
MDPPRPRPPEVGWSQEVGDRVRTWWLAKLLGTSLGMAAFFVAYFCLLRHPIFPVVVMPLTAADRLIGFQPEALPLYLSLWIYVSLAPALLTDRRELVSYGLATVVLSVIGLGVFLLWPTIVPRPEIDWSQHPSFIFLKSVDAAGNACPSLHVAFAVFTAVWFERILRQMAAGRAMRVLNWIWCAGIVYSTVATNQHVAIDALAGVVLGAGVALFHLRWVRAPRN